MKYGLTFLFLNLLIITSCEPARDNPLDPKNPDSNAVEPELVKWNSEELRPGEIILRWKEDKNALKYRIYKKGKSDGDFKLIIETAETEYCDTFINPCEEYQYKVVPLYKISDGAPLLEGSLEDAIQKPIRAPGKVVELRLIAPESLEAGATEKIKPEARYNCLDGWWEVQGEEGQPKWSVKGGGSITKDGLLKSEKAGEVEVKAEFNGVMRSIRVKITPGEPLLSKLTNPRKGFTGYLIDEPLEVKVKDKFDNPREGVSVRFKVLSTPDRVQNVKLSAEEIKTDRAGQARTLLTLGTKPGEYIIRAEIKDNPSQYVDFKVKAEPKPEKLNLSPKSAEIYPGGILELTVEVVDLFDNPVNGVAVKLELSQPGAYIDSPELKTDEKGSATAKLTAWKRVDNYRVTAISNGLRDDAEIKVTGIIPKRMIKLPHDGSKEIMSSVELSVKVIDEYENPVSDTEVEFSIISQPSNSEGAKLSLSKAETDENGTARVRFTLGTKVGEYIVHARNPELSGSPVEFIVQGLHGQPWKLEKISGDNQGGVVKRRYAKPFVVKVTDIGGNPIAGVKVKFEFAQFPGGSIGWQFSEETPSTDSNGEAKVWFTPGEKMGDYLVSASSNKLNGTPLQGAPVSFSCFAMNDEPQIISGVSGHAQTGVVGKPLSEPFVVKVTDRFNNPVDDVEVKFDIAKSPSEDARMEKGDVRTDALGLAKDTLTLATKTGEHQVNALWSSSEVPFTAKSIPDKPEKVIKISGDNQSGNARELLTEPLIAQVVDKYGNPCAKVKVGFSVAEKPEGASGMILLPEATSTDEQGYAQAKFTSGDKVGEYRIMVQLADSPEKLAIFSARAWECKFSASPDKLNFGYDKSDLNITLERKECAETLSFEVASKPIWVNVKTASGEISDLPVTLTVSVKREGLEPGRYDGALSIRFDGKTVDVSVSMEVRRNLIVRVFDARLGKAVEFAEVKADGRELIANNVGEAIFLDFKEGGEITIHASREGYIPKSEIVNVPKIGDFVAKIYLKPILKLIDEISSQAALPFVAPKFVAFSPDGMRAYVTNNMDNTVSVIDVNANRVAKKIKLMRGWPEEIVVNPVRDEAYVACNEDDSIVVINTKGDRLGRVIDVGNGPTGVAVSDDGNLLFVANTLENSVSIVETKTGQEKARIPVGKEPISIAVHQSFLYVSNQGDGTVSVIDVDTEREVDVIKVGDEPWGIAVSPCGKFAYVANYRSGTVSMIDTSSNEVVKTFDVGEFPVDIAVDPNCPDEDALYVTISSADSVTVIGVKAEIVLKRAISVGAIPQGIAITKDGGKIYVVNSDSETISALGF